MKSLRRGCIVCSIYIYLLGKTRVAKLKTLLVSVEQFAFLILCSPLRHVIDFRAVRKGVFRVA